MELGAWLTEGSLPSFSPDVFLVSESLPEASKSASGPHLAQGQPGSQAKLHYAAQQVHLPIIGATGWVCPDTMRHNQIFPTWQNPWARVLHHAVHTPQGALELVD